MIRILHLPGSVGIKNGRMHVIMNVYRQIDRSKIQFDFLATEAEGESFESEILEMGGKVFLIPEKKKNNFFLLSKKLKETLTIHNYAIIHYHATSQWAATLFSLHKYGIKKVIIHSHATVYSDSVLKSIRNRIISIPIFFSGTNFVAVTNEAGEKFFSKKKFEVIPNSIDIDRFKYNEVSRKRIRKSLNIKDNEVVIGNVGRFSKQKNQLFLLDIFREVLKNQNSDSNTWKLLLIGQGSLKNKLKEKVQLLDLQDHVIILNTKFDIESYYSAMDIFCFPSTYEGFGMAALEAQSNGLPTILSDVIPDDVKLRDSVQLNLNLGKVEWAKTLRMISSTKLQRSNGENIVKEAHFDSKYIANEWVNIYLDGDKISKN